MFQGMEYVYEVYKAGSFRQAAENLFISQPSISASVRRVEERVGCQIFDRSMKPLRLTQCGEQYIDSVEKIMQLERNFVEYVNDWGGLRRGNLVLGGSTFFSSLVLSHLMSRFHRMFPDIQLELVEDSTANLVDLIEDGTVDMVVDYHIPHIENYDWTVMQTEHLLLAGPVNYAVNEKIQEYRIHSEDIRSGQFPVKDRFVFRVLVKVDFYERLILLSEFSDNKCFSNLTGICNQQSFPIVRIVKAFKFLFDFP